MPPIFSLAIFGLLCSYSVLAQDPSVTVIRVATREVQPTVPETATVVTVETREATSPAGTQAGGGVVTSCPRCADNLFPVQRTAPPTLAQANG